MLGAARAGDFTKYHTYEELTAALKSLVSGHQNLAKLAPIGKTLGGRSICVPPRFMTEEMCHRNMAWTLYQADEMPLMKVGDTKVDSLGDDVYRVWVDLANTRLTPTIMAKAAQNNVVPPDILTVEGKSLEVISVSLVPSKYRPAVQQLIDQKDLKRLIVRNGHPGHATRTFQYLVKGSGDITFKYATLKGGSVQKTVTLAPAKTGAGA